MDSAIPPTTDEIFLFCPRFRILVIGRAGVGKSSLINKTFGVEEALVSHNHAGESDITHEILSGNNEHFVLHDSKGFEPGHADNLETVTNFINERRQKPELKDQLHAIWLCIQTPTAGGRLLETGDEKIIGLSKHVPIVVVFTKYDKLVETQRRNIPESHLANHTDESVAKKKADTEFWRKCVLPLRKVKFNIPYVKVSINDGPSLSDLTTRTYELVQKRFNENAAIVSATAQRGSSDPKVAASIIVGKRKYWSGLACSTHFPGRSLKSCLTVIHRDIVAVWNMTDKNKNLLDEKFMALISNADSYEEPSHINPTQVTTATVTGVGELLTHFGGLTGPAAPILIPIAGVFVIAAWAYSFYQESGPVLKNLMAYIVDLSITMENLFWLMNGGQSVTRRAIKLAFKSYNSEAKKKVHQEVEEYVKGTNVFDRFNRDGAFMKVKDLILSHRSDKEAMLALRAELESRAGPDESWEVAVT